jgi:hypothetical protein
MTIELTAQLLEGTSAYMFGRDSYYDGPCARSYDPWEHATDLGLRIVYRNDLPDPDMVACYSEMHRAIFARPDLHRAVERCAIAHEIVHHENADVGQDRTQERRADRIAARRLIKPSQVYDLAELTDDAAKVALDLEVTEHIMTVFLREYGGRE